MTRAKIAAALLLSALAAGCAPGGADPATPHASASASTNAAPTTRPSVDRAAQEAAAVNACDVYREAVQYFDDMGKSSKAIFGDTRNFADPRDNYFMGQGTWVDEHWVRRIAKSLTADVPQSVRDSLNRVVVDQDAANTALLQARPDSEYKPAAKKAGFAMDSADRVCGNHKR